MKIPASRLYPVSDKLPVELHPIMAAFMSFFWRNIDVYIPNKCKHMRRPGPMLWKLLCFLNPEYTNNDCKWKGAFPPSWRIQILKKKLTKADGNIMSPTEQLDYFAEVVEAKNGRGVICYLFEEDKEYALYRTKQGRNVRYPTNVPIVQLADGKFAATSMDSIFKYDSIIYDLD